MESITPLQALKNAQLKRTLTMVLPSVGAIFATRPAVIAAGIQHAAPRHQQKLHSPVLAGWQANPALLAAALLGAATKMHQ